MPAQCVTQAQSFIFCFDFMLHAAAGLADDLVLALFRALRRSPGAYVGMSADNLDALLKVEDRVWCRLLGRSPMEISIFKRNVLSEYVRQQQMNGNSNSSITGNNNISH